MADYLHCLPHLCQWETIVMYNTAKWYVPHHLLKSCVLPTLKNNFIFTLEVKKNAESSLSIEYSDKSLVNFIILLESDAKSSNNSNNWCWQNYEWSVSQTQIAIHMIQGNFDKHGTGERIHFRLFDWLQIFVFLRKLNSLLSHWAALALYSSVSLIMHGEGAQNFPNTFREIGRNSVRTFCEGFTAKPLALYTGDPFSLLTQKFLLTSNLGLSFDFLLGEKSS